MSMGFLLAVFINDELEAVLVGMMYFLQFKKIHTTIFMKIIIFFLALGTFLPNMLLSGLLWPLEGGIDFIKHIFL